MDLKSSNAFGMRDVISHLGLSPLLKDLHQLLLVHGRATDIRLSFVDSINGLRPGLFTAARTP